MSEALDQASRQDDSRYSRAALRGGFFMAGDPLMPFLPKLTALAAGGAALCLALAAGWSLDARARRAERVAVEALLESARADLAAMRSENASLRALGSVCPDRYAVPGRLRDGTF